MEEFDFPYHTFSTRYPETGYRTQLGNGYLATVSPVGPPQRTFVLGFDHMMYYCLIDGTPDATSNPKINMLKLENFYKAHETWKSFHYRHPTQGLLVVKFGKPLEVPKSSPGGKTDSFSVELLEQP